MSTHAQIDELGTVPFESCLKAHMHRGMAMTSCLEGLVQGHQAAARLLERVEMAFSVEVFEPR